MTITQQIATIIQDHPEGIPTLSHRAGVDHSQIYRLVRGQRGISLATLDRLADALDLVVVARRDSPQPIAAEEEQHLADIREIAEKIKGTVQDLAGHCERLSTVASGLRLARRTVGKDYDSDPRHRREGL